jgi:diguanylate cyclase (GGDEF)-like protein/PAS domain S-box-containing protein
MFVGLLSLADKFRSAEERLNFWLDSSVVAIGGSMVLWYFLIRPMAASHDGDWVKTALTICYPVSDLVLLLGISSLLMRRTGLSNEWPVNFLLIGCCVNFLADFVFSYQTIHGTYVSGSPVDALFTLACYPVMLGAHMQSIVASREAAPRRLFYQTSTRNFWLPYLAVAVVYCVRFAVLFESHTNASDWIIAVTGLVTALVIVRQFMFVRENTKANLALTELQERIQGIYSASTDAIGLADFNGTLNEVNDSFTRLTGYRRDEIVGTMKYQEFVPEDNFEASESPNKRCSSSIDLERELTRKDGSKRSVTTTLYPVNDGAGNPVAMAVVIRDITDRRALEDQLTHQAMHDALTGLANRALLQDRVTAALSRSKRRGTNVSLMFLDLDNFKTVNDTLGHAAGDTLLVTIADRLRDCLRISDTPARLGGDEFAVLLEDIDDHSEKITVAERLLEEIRRPVDIEGKQVFVGASIGIASSSPSDRLEDILRNADVAMYTAKRNGKNCFAVFEDSMHEGVIRRAQLENEMRGALANNEFKIMYQPIIELATERILGVEALLRWKHPRGVEVGPEEFIPIAEEANMISPLGKFVLQEALTQAGRWNRAFAANSPLLLSVNFSSRQFSDEDLIPSLVAACDEAGTRASDLMIEITEGTMLTNASANVKKLEELRKLGVKLAIDDFGTGYSSLSYLQKFPVDLLKIDRSFVEKMVETEEGEAMVKTIISMSKTLKLITVAEGIEELGQAEMLTALDCDWGQGYYFAKPLDVEGMDELLKNNLERTATRALPESASNGFGHPRGIPAFP